ncbi:hypothetical protein GCM10027425_15620 [Alteromonas gracilis]
MSVAVPQRPPVAARSDRRSAVPWLVGLTVALLPFLSPSGPGNIAPVDVAMAVSVAATLMWLAAERLPVSVPWAIGMGLMVLGGALAAVLAEAPGRTGLVLLQDLLLLGWAAVLAAGVHDVRIVRAAVVSWCRTAPLIALVGVLAYLIGFAPLSGVTAADAGRASYTFGDPNMAGSYLVMSLVLMAASRRPVRPGTRRAAYAIVLLALVLTGSNGAAVGLAIALTVMFGLARYRSNGLPAGVLTAVAVAATAVLLAGVVLPRVDTEALREQAAGSVPLLRDSIGRSDGSTGERERILVQGFGLYLDSGATGVGPARTKVSLRDAQASYVKEAHNDYLATLLERGLVGCLGLLLLGWSMLLRCRTLVVHRLGRTLSTWVPRPWLLAAVLPVVAVSAAFYEVLHFRHLWTWLGLIAVLVAWSEREA